MKSSTPILLVACSVLALGCGTDSAKRTGFETVQNLNERQCLEDLSAECPPRENYAEYERRLEKQKP